MSLPMPSHIKVPCRTVIRAAKVHEGRSRNLKGSLERRSFHVTHDSIDVCSCLASRRLFVCAIYMRTRKDVGIIVDQDSGESRVILLFR